MDVDEVLNITGEPHDSYRNDTCIAKRDDLTESASVVPAEYPPKVKLELFSQL